MVEQEVVSNRREDATVASQKSTVSARQKLNRVIVSAVIFLACPGDDIVAIAPSAISGNVNVQMAIEPETVLSMFWTDKQTKDREDLEKESAIKNT